MAVLDFVGYINTASPASAAEKALFLTDFCAAQGYTDTIVDALGNLIPNPESRKDFANRVILEWFKQVVRNHRFQAASNLIVPEPLELE
uniref:Uncharacterized protein n=1 Tax=viral metagenome TaxID=1070528 RepID=A0A6M3J325_9ZZZZ